MNILIANWTWFPSGGDWTYIESICKLYELHGHKTIPFSVHNEKNFHTPYENLFLNSPDYKKYYKGMSINTLFNVLVKSVYSVEAKKKLLFLLENINIDIAQLININNYHTPSIIPVLRSKKIPIVWRILDYKLICPNTTFLQHEKVCEECFKHKYYNCIVHKCKKNSLLASTLMAFESYFYYLLPIYNQVDLFLFQSEFTRDLFVKYGYKLSKTHIIENPYNCSSDQPKYEGENYILYFGRISKEKGILTLLKAMKLLPDIELKVVGDGPEFESYTTFVIENSISNVSFLGPKWKAELEPIIKDCEFVVVPSEWYEPSGYVVLQSFSYGKPVIAAGIGGLKDIVVNNKNGLLFESGNVDSLTKSIRSLFWDKKLIKKLGMSAREVLETKYNPERYYNDTINVFTDLINSKIRS
jgi:glycosyltransferase involved in cell wall biosynthesis